MLLDLTDEEPGAAHIVHVDAPTLIEIPDTSSDNGGSARLHISAHAGVGVEVARIVDGWAFRVAPRAAPPDADTRRGTRPPFGDRDRFLETMQRSLARSARTGHFVATFALDLEGFASVGDQLGPEAAADVVSGAGRLLSEACRPSDVIAHLGGSRFAVLCEDVTGARDAGSIAHRIAKHLETVLIAGPNNVELSLRTSIGISLDRGLDDLPHDLLQRAEIARKRSESEGTVFEIFDAAASRDAVRRLQLESEFSRGLPAGQLALHYQPILDLRSGQMTAAEALVRWDHPEHGLLRPAEFLDIADKIDLVAQLARWTIRGALAQLAEWDVTTQGKRTVALHVNISPSQLMDQRVLRAVRTALDDYAIAPSRLVLEITESAFIENGGIAERAIRRLRAHGVRFAIDDFGTGYSSLAYLGRIPADILKIDKAFVDGVGVDATNTLVAAAVISLAKAHGLTAIAEGVETQNQLEKLGILDCDGGQGFYIAPPLPATEALDVLRRPFTLGE